MISKSTTYTAIYVVVLVAASGITSCENQEASTSSKPNSKSSKLSTSNKAQEPPRGDSPAIPKSLQGSGASPDDQITKSMPGADDGATQLARPSQKGQELLQSPRPKGVYRFATTGRDFVQLVDITYRRKSVAFRAAIDGSCQREEKGIAKLRSGDPEMLEDENGVVFPANEYFHTSANGCYLAINIALNKDKAYIFEADCSEKCAFREQLMRLLPRKEE